MSMILAALSAGGGLLLFFIVLYIGTRMVAHAWFKSKREHALWDGVERRKFARQQEPQNGHG